MNISKQEAHESLNDIESVTEQTRKAIAYGASSGMLILWGVIWMIGYSVTQFYPSYAGLAWMPLIAIGAISCWILGARNHSCFRNPNAWRIGVFWLVLFAYAAVWLALLHPTNLPSGVEWAHYQPINDRQISAFFATVPMFAYVVGGLWFGRFFVWLGALVTVLTLVGFYLLTGWFQLWMAIIGGGSLMVAGLYIRNSWR